MNLTAWNRYRWWLLAAAFFILPSLASATPTHKPDTTEVEGQGGQGRYYYEPFNCAGARYAVGLDTFNAGGTIRHKTNDGVTVAVGGQYERETVVKTVLLEPAPTCAPDAIGCVETDGDNSSPRPLGEVRETGRVGGRVGYDFTHFGGSFGVQALYLEDGLTALPAADLWAGTDWAFVKIDLLPMNAAIPNTYLDLGLNVGNDTFRGGVGLLSAPETGGPYVFAQARVTESGWIGAMGVLGDDTHGLSGFGQLTLRFVR